jgi:NADH pyrophosphatase NudC (nudix superfamily)
VHWDNPVPVVAALVSRGGRYIVARNRAWPDGIFSLVSGYLERGESPELAVKREVEEELGLKAEAAKLLIGNYAFPEKNQVILAYEVIASGSVRLNHELAEWRELSEKALCEYNFSPLHLTEQIIHDWKALSG